MDISREEIRQASWDARLELTPEEMDGLEKQLDNFLQLAGFLQHSDLNDAEATFYPHERRNTVRDDMAAPSLPPGKALANAPETEGEYILVPKIVE